MNINRIRFVIAEEIDKAIQNYNYDHPDRPLSSEEIDTFKKVVSPKVDLFLEALEKTWILLTIHKKGK